MHFINVQEFLFKTMREEYENCLTPFLLVSNYRLKKLAGEMLEVGLAKEGQFLVQNGIVKILHIVSAKNKEQ